MNWRNGLLTALGLVVFGPVAAGILSGCGTQEGASKSLLSGLLLEDTASIDVETSTNGVDADETPGPIIEVGGQVVWLYVVTNNGNTSLTDIAVVDDQGATISCPGTTLESGESMNCVALGAAIDGQYTNVGTATAIDPDGNAVTDSDASAYFGGTIPSGAAVDIEVATNGEDADDLPGPTLNVGDAINWTYVVTNNSLADLTSIAVIDSEGVTVECPQDALAAGESMTCTASGTAVEGQYANIGIVSASDSTGDVVTDFDWSHYLGQTVVVVGPIDIETATNGEDADEVPGPTIAVGGAVSWTYVVTNTSDGLLSNVVVTDDQGVIVTCPATELAAGESMTCTAEGVAAEGQYANVGTVTADDSAMSQATDSDPSHYFGGASGGGAAIDIEKSTNGEDADEAPGPTIAVGTTVTWEYVVTNIGDVALTNVTVTDDQGVIVTCPATELAAGESMTCTADDAAIEGQYANIGTVTALDPENNEVSDSDASHYYGELVVPGDAGCGLGFWKNHLDAWEGTGYSPDQSVSSVFASAAAYPGLADVTLAQALRLKGGPTVEAAAGLLLKHAVAALLNAAHPDVNFALTEAEVIDLTNANLDSGDRTTMLSAKGDVEGHNEMGCHLGWSNSQGKGRRHGND